MPPKRSKCKGKGNNEAQPYKSSKLNQLDILFANMPRTRQVPTVWTLSVDSVSDMVKNVANKVSRRKESDNYDRLKDPIISKAYSTMGSMPYRTPSFRTTSEPQRNLPSSATSPQIAPTIVVRVSHIHFKKLYIYINLYLLFYIFNVHTILWLLTRSII